MIELLRLWKRKKHAHGFDKLSSMMETCCRKQAILFHMPRVFAPNNEK
jgi:hypothetical protein